MNRRGVTSAPVYLMIGIVMLAAVLKSGAHATLAGVTLAMFIPLRAAGSESPLRRLEHELHPAVAFGILPLFAFANAGVPLEGITPATLAGAVPAGIALGLLFGKFIGVFGASWPVIRLGFARLPDATGWAHLAGAALLCGIGFTVSLFIASLAFEGEAASFGVGSRLGILLGSIVAGIAGYLVLRFAPTGSKAHSPSGSLRAANR